MDTTTDDGTVTDGDDVAQVRAFNRFYTRLIGVLGQGIAQSPFSLTEARVLFELAEGPEVEAAALRARLSLDAGYLSRLIDRFERQGLVDRRRSTADGRRVVLALTGAGREAFADLDRRASAEVRELLGGLDAGGRRRLRAAMGAIRSTFDTRSPAPRGYLIREVGPGDMGWIVSRHGALYAEEYGWDTRFEGFVARIAADYLTGGEPGRETAWVAEVDGVRAGCIACTREDDETARLRLLLVEPHARGLGIGSRLVDECLRFARRAGYRRITLWTYDVLADARRLYRRAGFGLDRERVEQAFGHDLVQQDWSRPL